MKRFFFTYGSGECGMPYVGGWTEVVAPDIKQAVMAFRFFHPDRIPNCLNCCSVYSEEDFMATCMGQEGVNCGAGCREVITFSITREIKEATA